MNTSVEFKKVNHFWIDGGLIGLYLIIVNNNLDSKYNIQIKIDNNLLKLKSENKEDKDNILKCLNEAYDILLDRHWNISSTKQKERLENFYYDESRDIFIRIPKIMPHPIAGIYVKKPDEKSFKAIPYKELNKELQKKVDEYLKTNKLTLYGSKKKLLFEPPRYKPRVYIMQKGKKKNICYLCGNEHYNDIKVSQTVFPLFAGSGFRTFYTECSSHQDTVCWKCDFLGKFTVESIFFKVNKSDYFIFIPYSESLDKMIEINEKLRDLVQFDENYYTNIKSTKKDFINYANRPFELLVAFLYIMYRQLIKIDNKNESEILKQLYNIAIKKGPITLYFLNLEEKGNTFLGKLAIPFTDTIYMFKLFYELETAKINIDDINYQLIDYSVDKFNNQSLFRNKLWRKVISKEPIVILFEQFMFHTCRKKDSNTYFNDIIKFIKLYQTLFVRRRVMTKEQIEIATNLGKSIGHAIATSNFGKKGDLFSLRKKRKKGDFLNELNRLQFKYGLSISNELLGGILEEVDFQEFKAYCMIAALNNYNYNTKISNGGKNNDK